MIDASNSFVPAFVNTAPFPALNNGESSMIRIVVSTASILGPPFSRISNPAASASVSLPRYADSFSEDIFFLVMVPAPP